MSNANVMEKSALYRADVVETFRQAAETEVQRLSGEVTELQQRVNHLTQQIRDREEQVTQYQRVMSMVTAHEDLPPAPPTCRSCGWLIVLVSGTWWHEGGENNQVGFRCNPDDKNSPVAEPAKGTSQAFGDWSGAIAEERAGGHS